MGVRHDDCIVWSYYWIYVFLELEVPFVSSEIFGYHEVAHLLLGISHIFGFFMVRSIFLRIPDDIGPILL
jgi:hypothetical protein